VRKLPIILLILTLLASCQRTAPPDPPVLTDLPVDPPTATPLPRKTIARVEEELAWTLSSPTYLKQRSPSGDAIPTYHLTGLSSGEVTTLDIEGYRLDLLPTYFLMIPGPVRIPLVVGFEDLANGSYTSLVVQEQDLAREDLLAQIPSLYPRWQEVQAVILGDFVSPTGLDWSACTGSFPSLNLSLAPSYCALGKLLEEQFSSEMHLFRLQALDQVPIGFALPWLMLPPPEPLPTLSPDQLPGGQP
jgi:hypothetical protein